MRKTFNFFVIPVLAGIILSVVFLLNNEIPQMKKNRSSLSPKAAVELKKARDEYFLMMLRDPATGKIPANARNLELEFAKRLAKNTLNKSTAVNTLDWKEAGPYDVGGRTRALAVDVTNSNTIIAGGISGGIWKSTDNGTTWKMKSTTNQLLSVTSVAQDPRAGHTNTWYYTTGEFSANSAMDQGGTAFFYGNGVYKSTDNGESWFSLTSTAGTNPTAWEPFDKISRVAVNPTTGTVFIAVNAYGIFKSTDEGNKFTFIVGGTGHHIYSDVVISANGTVLISLSSPYDGYSPTTDPGIYKSANDGANWTKVTPNNFPSTHHRTVLAIAPSNQNAAYALTFTGSQNNDKEDIRFYKLNLANASSEDRSANLPAFTTGTGGFFDSQGSYNMTLAIKPDDENFVIIGGTSLFRSFDGFATKPQNAKTNWIGGYHPEDFFYENLHPDIHSFAFDPNDPKKVWFGHDGGLSYSQDITVTSYTKLFPWINKNNGYNVTQFYHLSIPADANDYRIMGGCQDNGTPFFTFDGNSTSAFTDVSTGDGSYSYFGKNFAYTSSQSGSILRIKYNIQAAPDFSQGWTRVTPTEAANQLFINPFVVDPNNENVMYYPAGNVLWRNNNLSGIPDYEQNGTSLGWTKLTSISIPSDYNISSMSVSSTPAHVLYFGASKYGEGAPKVYRLDNSATSTASAADISIPAATDGYVHNIAVNPDNADEIIVVLSNYNIVGLYYSANGGQSYTAIEGNLEGTQQNPGPSLRAASILPTSEGNIYLVATSIGVFSTRQLSGTNTSWTQEGANTIGNVVVNYIACRKSDNRIVAATHGRGSFVATGTGGSGGTPVASSSIEQLTLNVRPDETGSAKFLVSNTGTGSLNYSITASAQFGQPNLGNRNIIYVNDKPVKSKLSLTLSNSYMNKPIVQSNALGKNTDNPPSVLGSDVIIYDDGNNSSDDFLGYGGANFGWANGYNLDKAFKLEKFQFFMRSESASSNSVFVGIYDKDINALASGIVNATLAQNGAWTDIELNNPIDFSAGQQFYIFVQTQGTNISYPAGVDKYAQVAGKSYYIAGEDFVNLDTEPGFQTGAFLIRAVGTFAGAANQPPVAIAKVSADNAKAGEQITFDASDSYDTDGNIVQYNWNFGDGTTSSNKTDSHSYSQANTYTVSLTVTDDKGVTGETSFQITVTEGQSRITVTPANGNISGGNSQEITISVDAAGLNETTYTGQITITSNGGNIVIPLTINVSSTFTNVVDKSEIPSDYFIKQNYPNPFNPTTTIKYALPKAEKVEIVIYDMKGSRITELVNKHQNAGTYEISWNGKDNFGNSVATGVYLYAIRAGSFYKTNKMILLK